MKLYIPCFFVLLLSINALNTHAQERPINDETKPFFENQLPNYQQWLESNGITQILAIEKMDLRPDLLTLSLYLTAYDKDSANDVWDYFKEKYDQQHAFILEEDMFNYLYFLMELPPEKILIEIYDVTENDPRVPCFYRGIFFENGEFGVDKAPCMGLDKDVQISMLEIRPDLLGKKDTLSGLSADYKTKRLIFQEIEVFCEEYFDGRADSIIVHDRRDRFQLEVKDMKRQILPPTLFTWFTGPQKERLGIIVSYEFTGQDINLRLKVHGKYGSGLWSILDSGYRPMEPDYTSYLKTFVNVFHQDLIARLTQR